METHHRTPGNLRAFVQAKLRNLRTRRSSDVRFTATEDIEVLTTDRQTFEYSYHDRDMYSFMNPETYESIELTEELVAENKHYLAPNCEVEILYVDGVPVDITLPPSVNLKVTESAAGIKGDTASNVSETRDSGDGTRRPGTAIHQGGGTLEDQHHGRLIHGTGVNPVHATRSTTKGGGVGRFGARR